MFALEGLAPIDGWTVAAIVAKAAGTALALLAMGGPLFLAVFARETTSRGGALARPVRRITAVSALSLLAVLALRFAIRSARISGMGVEGMADPTMLAIVWDSPLGAAAIWRGVGSALVLAVLARGRLALACAIGGAVTIALSFAQVGHALGEPRWPLGALVVLHLLAAAWWVAALPPLRRAADMADGASLLHRFGTIAIGIVAMLVAAGIALAWMLSGSPGALLGTAYGWILLAKVALVGGLLGLAALNRLRLVPALAAGERSAARALRRSIAREGSLVALILLVTATLTSITTPPAAL